MPGDRQSGREQDNVYHKRLAEPADADPGDYLRAVEGGDHALHVYLKDDKEWWLAHLGDGEAPPGHLNGPWLMWTTYPSGPWTLNYCTRQVLFHHVEELYYRDYNGEETHSVHENTVVPISDAPGFVQAEVTGLAE